MRTLNFLTYVPLITLLTACTDLGPPATDESTTAVETTVEPATTDAQPTTTNGIELECTPGTERCADDNTREICKPTGLSWKQEACGDHQKCTQSGNEPAACVGPCEVASSMPNSLGCEFLAIRMRSGNGDEDLAEFYDAIIVGNPDDSPAEVQLYHVPDSTHQDEPVDEPVLLGPGESHIFKLTSSTISGFSTIRVGGVYRVKSDIPIIAYLHSPLKNSNSNDSSLLLPVKSLRQDYVVASYPAFVDAKNPKGYGGRPSYFNAIALENDTKIEWVPKRDSAGNGLAPRAIPAGVTGVVRLNKFDVLQVGASTLTNLDYATHDMSGTVVHADKPIWLLGGTSCARVPYESIGYCNHLQEQMIPIEYWGKKYVAAHSPLRNQEKHYWRVYAGEDNVIVTTDPSQPPGTLVLNKKGDFKDMIVASGKSFTFQGTGAFMPVQYLASYAEAGKVGDPAMYQTIPVEQFIKRYVFITGVGYQKNYAQIVRVQDAADVFINGTKVEDYYSVVAVTLNYEIADVELDPGDEPKVYVVESEDEFGVSVLGYTTTVGGGSAYAYPGGMALRELTPQ
jgi:hypothetical protein